MTNVFIIHGICGCPEENWFPWLKKELESSGCDVFVPRFPNPDHPKLTEWLEFFGKYQDNIKEDSIVVGHSLSVSFLLRILEEHPVKSAFFVAGFTGVMKNEFAEDMKTFTERKFNWENIRKNCKHFEVFHSDNDPYVPVEKGKEIARNLGVELTLVKGAGHFNAKAGYTEFPLLLERIKQII